jgi:hypothetical protein
MAPALMFVLRSAGISENKNGQYYSKPPSKGPSSPRKMSQERDQISDKFEKPWNRPRVKPAAALW